MQHRGTAHLHGGDLALLAPESLGRAVREEVCPRYALVHSAGRLCGGCLLDPHGESCRLPPPRVRESLTVFKSPPRIFSHWFLERGRERADRERDVDWLPPARALTRAGRSLQPSTCPGPGATPSPSGAAAGALTTEPPPGHRPPGNPPAAPEAGVSGLGGGTPRGAVRWGWGPAWVP